MKRSANGRYAPGRRVLAPLAGAALLAGSLLIGPVVDSNAQPAAARVLVASGPATVTAAGSTTRVPASGSELFVGDTLRVGDGLVQIRFASGLLVSLARAASLRIDPAHAASPTDGVVPSLLEGDCRVMTRARPGSASHRVATAFATLDSDDAAYRLSSCREPCGALPPGLHVAVDSGRLVVSNAGGTLTVRAGEFAHVASERSRPLRVATFGATEALPLPGTGPVELPECKPGVFGGCV